MVSFIKQATCIKQTCIYFSPENLDANSKDEIYPQPVHLQTLSLIGAFVIFSLESRKYVPCGHLLGKGWPLGSRFWCLTVSLSLSLWYPEPGVVLGCIDYWSLHPYLLNLLQCAFVILFLESKKKNLNLLQFGAFFILSLESRKSKPATICSRLRFSTFQRENDKGANCQL